MEAPLHPEDSSFMSGMPVTTLPVASALKERSPYQPYQCPICQSRFTRHENLKRHASLHSRSHNETTLFCDFCDATFSRSDLRHRHMKRKHPEQEVKQRRKRSHLDLQESAQCSNRRRPPVGRRQSTSLADTRGTSYPQHSGDEREMEMNSGSWSTGSRYGQDRLHGGHQTNHLEGSNYATEAQSSADETPNQALRGPLAQQTPMSDCTAVAQITSNMTDLEPNLLTEVSILEPTNHTVPQMRPTTVPHYASFNACSPGFGLGQGVHDQLSPVDSPQYQDDWYPSIKQIERGYDLHFTHVSHFVPFLHRATFDVARTASHLILSMLSLAFQYGEDPECDDQVGSGASLSAHCFRRARILTVREEEKKDESPHDITMVQTYLLLQLYAMMYSSGNHSAYGLKTHSKMISAARASGLVHPIMTETTTTGDLESLWLEFVKDESHKRTFFAVHQIDSLWYQLLSIPRSLSHLEIKRNLPCPEEYWTASSSGEWAHRQLTTKYSGASVQYSDAVRRFLASDAGIHSIPAFDPYGAINLTQFLISSAREISGWSTMTGMLSLERLEPLRTSLLALGTFIRSQHAAGNQTHSALSEATWESAMIELQMWSPSHTGGIVEGSIEAVSQQLTYLTPCSEFLCEPNTAKAIRPHIDWFLHYLDTTIVPDSEAPWVAVYAYKAFILAWQLLRGGILSAMQTVGLQDGDVDGALEWARKVFRRRERWQVGKIILRCLDTLATMATP